MNIHVLKGLDFSVEAGEFVEVMGKSGCGKTTLLKTLGLIHRPTSGSVWLEGEDTGKLPEETAGFELENWICISGLLFDGQSVCGRKYYAPDDDLQKSRAGRDAGKELPPLPRTV